MADRNTKEPSDAEIEEAFRTAREIHKGEKKTPEWLRLPEGLTLREIYLRIIEAKYRMNRHAAERLVRERKPSLAKHLGWDVPARPPLTAQERYNTGREPNFEVPKKHASMLDLAAVSLARREGITERRARELLKRKIPPLPLNLPRRRPQTLRQRRNIRK